MTIGLLTVKMVVQFVIVNNMMMDLSLLSWQILASTPDSLSNHVIAMILINFSTSIQKVIFELPNIYFFDLQKWSQR